MAGGNPILTPDSLNFPCTFRNRLTASCEAISMSQTLTVVYNDNTGDRE